MASRLETAEACEGQQTLFDGQVPVVSNIDEVAKANSWGGITINRVSDPYYSQLVDVGRITVWNGGSINISPLGIRTPIPKHKPIKTELSGIQNE